jgi:hypothetical protein
MRNKETEQKESGQTQSEVEPVSRARKIGHFLNRGSRHPLFLIAFTLSGVYTGANLVADHVNETMVTPLRNDLHTTGSQVQSLSPKIDELNATARDGSTSLAAKIDNTNSALNQVINSGPMESKTPPSTVVVPAPDGGRSENAGGPIPATIQPTTTSTTTTTPAPPNHP